MRREKPRLDAAGLAVVLVGLGMPDDARAFRSALRLPFPILADPDKAAYHRYGLLRADRRRLRDPRTIWRLVVAALRHGGALSRRQDMAQLGGTFVIGRDGVIRYAHRSVLISDHPPTDELLAAAG